jgi:hypothetical protein
MRRFAAVVLASLVAWAVAASAASATSPTAPPQRLSDPENGKIVLFGCGPTPFMKRVGSTARFEATSGPGAVRGKSYATFHSPLSDSASGTAYRGVTVGVPLGFVQLWLPERCFHLVVPSATVTCASPVFDDAAAVKQSGYSVAPGELVYPAASRSAGDYDYVYTHRPDVEGFVPHRCLRSGSPNMRALPSFRLPVASPTPH